MKLHPLLSQLSLGLALSFLALGSARAFDTQASAVWVYDTSTHTVLMDKNADESLPPASMSKLMTINMLFEALRDGRVSMDTAFPVSSRATSMKGSTMFLQESDRPTVAELLRGMIINSGNDACVVVAEGLAGTEEAFAKQMTERARALGMTGSHFANASGWPHPEHRMSMRDLGLLGQRLTEEFPEYYPMFAETEFDFKGRSPANRFNRNPLLKLGINADGLKTGHTQEAGYGLVGSAKQGDRRVIFAVTGLQSEKARADEAERIVSWAFRQFVEKTVAKGGARIADAEVFMGNSDHVGLVATEDLTLLVPALVQENVRAEISYKGPLQAPIAQGQEVAEMIVFVPGLPERRVTLVAETAVDKAGFGRRLSTAAKVLLERHVFGNNGEAKGPTESPAG